MSTPVRLRYIVPIIIIATALGGCEEDTRDFSSLREACPESFPLAAPPGASLSEGPRLGDEVAGERFWLTGFRFFTDRRGVALNNQIFGAAPLFVTSDGGWNWRPLPVRFDRRIADILFVDEERFFAVADCPGDYRCRKGTTTYGTTDGGLTWTTDTLPADLGRVGNVAVGPAGDLYASSHVGDAIRLVRSRDGGRSFDVVAASPDMLHSQTNFTYAVTPERYFVTAEDDRLLVLDTLGRVIVNAAPGIRFVKDVVAVDSAVVLVAGYDGLVRSLDGGVTWTQLHDRETRLYGFDAEGRGFVLRELDDCLDYDVSYPYDELAYFAAPDGPLVARGEGTKFLSNWSYRGSDVLDGRLRFAWADHLWDLRLD